MLQRGLSNRPTGAVALLLLGAGYILNLAQTDDRQNFLAKTLFGAPVKEALVFVEKTGAAIDHVFLSWGEMLENESQNWGCHKREQVLAQRTNVAKPRLGCKKNQGDILILKSSRREFIIFPKI